jgi:hydroxyethylthiazole kinase-like uncharacterized protein yjeF
VIPVLTPAEMVAVDAAAAEPVSVLIERAAGAVAAVALSMLGGGYGRRVVVLAGKGNNGADGRAAALRLRRRGARVVVVDAAMAPARLPAADLVIDAAFGTGFRGEHHAPDAGDAAVLAVDIPSGVDGVTGEVRGRALPATRTVTFVAPKPGLLFEPGRQLAGDVVVADIGLAATSDAAVVEAADVAAWLPGRVADDHKWRAAVLVVAGSPGMTGAAHLAAAAAARTGAGMVRVGSPGLPDDPGRPTEAVGVCLPETEWAATVLADVGRFHALVIGPGLGTAATTQQDIRRVVAAAPIPVVVDSDGLTALGAEAGSTIRARTAGTILTPHDGEFARLTGGPPGADRIAAARSLAEQSGAVTLLKGATTVVADPTGSVRIVMSGDARLATAGTGDVLSGIIGALLARGLDAFDAAAAGAWLHGRAAVLGSPEGFVARDLLDLVPAALLDLRNGGTAPFGSARVEG